PPHCLSYHTSRELERGSGNFCSLANLWFANESARPLVFALCRLRRPSVPALRIACARASSRFAASNGQRSGRECIFSANASVCSAKNARNDVHAVISDESLVLPRLCQYSVAWQKVFLPSW